MVQLIYNNSTFNRFIYIKMPVDIIKVYYGQKLALKASVQIDPPGI